MSKKLTYILIFALVAVMLAGIAIGIVVLVRQDGFDKEITLSAGGSVQEEIQFNLEGMYPGQSAEYSVHFGGSGGDTYALTLSFRANGNTELAEYVTTELELNGEKVSEGGLAEYLGGERVFLTLPQDSVLVFRYRMPLEVGNEAQGLAADFVVEIEAAPAA